MTPNYTIQVGIIKTDRGFGWELIGHAGNVLRRSARQDLSQQELDREIDGLRDEISKAAARR